MLDIVFTIVYGYRVAKDKGETMTPFDDLPLFRNTDPQGSVNGAKHIKLKRTSQAMRLLAVYNEHPIYGLLDEEAANHAKIAGGWKRCADLRRLGYIKPTGEMAATLSGVKAMVCRITSEGMEALIETRS
jgi:hypothetical protein